MRASQSKYHSIRQQHTRCIELTGTATCLVIVHICGKHRFQGMVAILVVRFDNGVQILEACLIAPYFIIKEIPLPVPAIWEAP